MAALREGFGGDGSLTIVIVEVERFASFRQLIGTAAADRVMATVRALVEAELVPCMIGRVGRTTIEVALPSADRPEIERHLHQLRSILSQRIDVDGVRLDPVIRIGAARRRAAESEEELLDQAAAAVEAAREDRAPQRWAEDTDPRRLHDDAALMGDLARAIEGGGLELHYQPKLDLKTNRVASAEALLRWPGRGVPTDIGRLVALAESTGLIGDVTDWALRRAVADQRRLAEAAGAIRVDVNISGVLLTEGTFFDRLHATLGDSEAIGLEITETAVIAEPEAALANLRRCSDAGLHIAIDDYGSGLSSLAYLKQLPARELKIDRLFVSGLVTSHRDPLLVRSSIDLAHALEMEVTAEGVDDPMTLALLRIMGCDIAQGYLIAPPMPIDALTTFVTDPATLARLDGAAAPANFALRAAR
jgi:EAL domain-containing protein (putative c-di-GMP-specific phosphodiesterase class I)/GGDEF domain-containing protein